MKKQRHEPRTEIEKENENWKENFFHLFPELETHKLIFLLIISLKLLGTRGKSRWTTSTFRFFQYAGKNAGSEEDFLDSQENYERHSRNRKLSQAFLRRRMFYHFYDDMSFRSA